LTEINIPSLRDGRGTCSLGKPSNNRQFRPRTTGHAPGDTPGRPGVPRGSTRHLAGLADQAKSDDSVMSRKRDANVILQGKAEGSISLLM